MPQQNASAVYSGAFVDPVFGSQHVFRAVMDAMARPGTVHNIFADGVRPPAPLTPGAGAIALCLCDGETPVWLTPALRRSPVGAWLAFHAGATVTDHKGQARFALVEAGGLFPGFAPFAQGTSEYPDRSTTLIVEIAAFDGGAPLIASGPGIQKQVMIAPQGLPAAFLDLWTENHALFPCGVDLALVAGTDVLCLPRTTKLREA